MVLLEKKEKYIYNRYALLYNMSPSISEVHLNHSLRKNPNSYHSILVQSSERLHFFLSIEIQSFTRGYNGRNFVDK